MFFKHSNKIALTHRGNMEKTLSLASRLTKRLMAQFKKTSSVGSDIYDPKKTFEVLRQKWNEIPSGGEGRVTSESLLNLSDEALVAAHELSTKKALHDCRGWYHCLYKDVVRGKRVLDVGSGFGIDGIAFAREGAFITFLDIVESNILVLKRLCKLLDIKNVDFVYMKDISSLVSLRNDFDVIWCDGSLIHAPFDVIREETHELIKHLKPRGRWIELCYPKERWEREGRLPFALWGKRTDGETTPWAEWYDLPKLLTRFEPFKPDVILNFNFHNDDYVWFDLVISENKTDGKS
jgi:2-polyprenyl-3-methyl-5-hydroxy-6-metoxy-1,4-benzoquinol methylase